MPSVGSELAEERAKRRDNSWREVKMVEVTGEQYAALAMGTWTEGVVPRRSGRVRFPPLEVGAGAPWSVSQAWRGERVVFERPRGSLAPQMRGVRGSEWHESKGQRQSLSHRSYYHTVDLIGSPSECHEPPSNGSTLG